MSTYKTTLEGDQIPVDPSIPTPPTQAQLALVAEAKSLLEYARQLEANQNRLAGRGLFNHKQGAEWDEQLMEVLGDLKRLPQQVVDMQGRTTDPDSVVKALVAIKSNMEIMRGKQQSVLDHWVEKHG